jgi:hypothetical protein
MAMNKQRKSSNLINILSYDDAGNIVLRDYSQTIRYNWNGTIHAFTGPLSISSVAAAVTDTDRFLVSDGGVLKYRTGAEVLSDIGAIGGSGVAGQVAYWNGTSSQTGSNNLFWDSANARLGIGTNAPAYKLHVIGDSFVSNDLYVNRFIIMNTADKIKWITRGSLYAQNNGDFAFRTETDGNVARFSNTTSFISSGNFILGGTTDGGQRLQVQGDAFIKGSGTGGTIGFLLQNSSAANLLRIQNNGVFLIGNSSVRPIIFTFTTSSGSSDNNGTNLSFYNYTSTESSANGLFAFENTSTAQTSGINSFFRISSNFVPTSGNANFSLLYINNTVNQTGGANGITRGLYIQPSLTSAADWRSIQWDNNSGWGLYGAGTANNYIGGALSIGTIGGSRGLRIGLAPNAADSSSNLVNVVIPSIVTSSYRAFASSIGLNASGFTLPNLSHFEAIQDGAFTAGVVTNHYGFRVNALISGTNIYGFHSNLASATGVWNLYMAGTADNYLAGKLLIGTATVSTFALDVNGTARVSGAFGVNGFDSLYNQKLYVNGNIRIQDGNGVGDTDSNTGEWIKFSSINGVTLGTGGAERLRITSGGNLLVGTTADQGYRVQITSASADSQLNVWGATAPSIRLDNAASGATQRFVIGLATATNNFIQGANAGDVCMTPGTSSALVFGMWQTSSSSEVMRISTSSNVLIGTSTDVGAKLRVVGDISASVDLRLTRTGTSPAIILDQTQLRLVNQTSGFGIGLNVEQDIIRFGGAIRTNPPAGSGNPEYKLGSYSATAPTATGYLNIEVGGVVYKVLAST